MLVSANTWTVLVVFFFFLLFLKLSVLQVLVVHLFHRSFPETVEFEKLKQA